MSVDLCDLSAKQESVIKAARRFCQVTEEEMGGLEGSNSLDIPVEFMELHHAIEDLEEVGGFDE